MRAEQPARRAAWAVATACLLCVLTQAAFGASFEEELAGAYARADVLKERGSRSNSPGAGADANGKTEALQNEIIAHWSECLPVMEELRGILERYPTGNDPSALEEERGRLRTELQGRGARIAANLTALRPAAIEAHRRQFGALLSVGTADPGNSIDRTIYLHGFLSVAAGANDGLSNFLDAEEKRFAQRRRARRAAQATRLALAAAALLAVGVIGFKLRRGSPAPVAATGATPRLDAPADRRLAPSGALLGAAYRLERELGRGGMGIVYEATDIGLSRKVAVKLMREEISGKSEGLHRFLSEARLVAKLSHPNIVKIHTVLQEKGKVYLVFEHVEGRTLSARLDGGARVPLDETREILRQLAAALDYAHSERIIHRDLKPGNVMISKQGQVKVMDFGLAHQARLSAAKLTRAEAWGTLPYMAPEQELGEVSRESDIFSLGVCLYEMLTGRLPYDGPNYLDQKRERRFAPPSRVAPALPPGLDALLARALEPESSARYHSAGELAAAVEAL